MTEIPRADEEMDFARLLPPPNAFLCPITQEIMREPVAAADGFVYEKASIEEWFKNPRGGLRSPMTNAPLPTEQLSANLALRRAIEEYLQHRPELERREVDRASLRTTVSVLAEELQMKVTQGPFDKVRQIAERIRKMKEFQEAAVAQMTKTFEDTKAALEVTKVLDLDLKSIVYMASQTIAGLEKAVAEEKDHADSVATDAPSVAGTGVADEGDTAGVAPDSPAGERPNTADAPVLGLARENDADGQSTGAASSASEEVVLLNRHQELPDTDLNEAVEAAEPQRDAPEAWGPAVAAAIEAAAEVRAAVEVEIEAAAAAEAAPSAAAAAAPSAAAAAEVPETVAAARAEAGSGPPLAQTGKKGKRGSKAKRSAQLAQINAGLTDNSVNRQKEAVLVLKALVLEDASAKAEICNDSALGHLLALLRSGSTAVQVAALSALAALADGDTGNCALISMEGGISPVLLLLTGPSTAEVQVEAAHALELLANDEATALNISKEGGARTLMSLFKSTKDDKVKLATAHALYAMANSDSVRKRLDEMSWPKEEVLECLQVHCKEEFKDFELEYGSKGGKQRHPPAQGGAPPMSSRDLPYPYKAPPPATPSTHSTAQLDKEHPPKAPVPQVPSGPAAAEKEAKPVPKEKFMSAKPPPPGYEPLPKVPGPLAFLPPPGTVSKKAPADGESAAAVASSSLAPPKAHSIREEPPEEPPPPPPPILPPAKAQGPAAKKSKVEALAGLPPSSSSSAAGSLDTERTVSAEPAELPRDFPPQPEGLAPPPPPAPPTP